VTDVTQVAARAIREMRDYQAGLRRDPTHAHVLLGDLRHALIPTHVLARDLPAEVESLVGRPACFAVTSRIGRVIGQAHAKAFFAYSGGAAEGWDFRVLSGPMYFAWTGFGDVDLLLWEIDSAEDFAILWESDNSFSATEALQQGDRGRSCHMQAGYAAGWCEVATGMQLETREIACRAEGVSHCRFLVAPAKDFEERILGPRFHRPTSSYSIMRFKSDSFSDEQIAAAPPRSPTA